MDITDIINNIHPLPNSSAVLLQSHISTLTLPKGHTLLHADKVETSIYFIKKGIARAYSSNKDGEVTFWFGREGDTVISMKSYVADEKGYENIELLEPCELYEIKIPAIRALYNQNIHIANWGRKFAEQELLKTEERLISKLFKTSTERYQDIISDHPYLLQRVQLSHIASYLGITPASFSRIRAELK